MPLQIARKAQQLAAHPSHSVWVAASAGSGKTKVLTDRVLNLLLEGYAPERILCLTFTKAAAAEMANRVRARLGEWAILPENELRKSLENIHDDPPSDEKIERARTLFGLTLDTPGGLKIQTIHSFCQSLLKRFPLEAGLSPFFEVANNTQRHTLLKNASYKAMEDQSYQDLILHYSEQNLQELNEFILQARGFFKDLALGSDENKTNKKHRHCEARRAVAIQKVTKKLDSHVANAPRNDDGGVERQSAHDFGIENIDTLLETSTLTEPSLFQVLIAHIPQENLRKNLSLFDEGSPSDQTRGKGLAFFLSLTEEEKIQKYEDYLSLFLTQKGEKRACLLTQKVAAKSPSFKTLLEEEALRLEKWKDAHHRLEISTVSKALLRYGVSFLEAYENLKKTQSLLDYEDLIIKAAALLKNPGCHWVLYKLDGGLDHILVDEAQDTSPIQWQVIRSIAEEFYANSLCDTRDRTLFIVGDGKQSIYSFQGADPAVFSQMQQDLSTFARNSGKTWKDIDLTVSFRSTPQVLAVVDAVFSACPLSHPPLDHIPFRKESLGHVEVWPLIKEEKGEPLESWLPPLAQRRPNSPQKRLAQLIAKTIKGWLVAQGPLAKPISPGDILILVRHRTAFVDTLIRALKELAIPVAGMDRLWLLDTLVVQDLLKIAEFLLLPQDDLTLATVLKGPLCDLSEEDLFKLAHGREKLSLWQRLQQDKGFEEVKTILNDLLSRVDFLTPFSLFSYILGPLSGRKKWQARLGSECLDALDEFLNLCLHFQEEKTPSLQGFLHWISQEVIELKRDLDQSNQVRIMTVHGSKGLQAPIVFLPDTTHVPLHMPPFECYENTLVWLPPSLKEISLTKELKQKLREKQQEENNRLLYVALTRAEDALYVCGWEGSSQKTWYDLVKEGIQKIGEEVDFDEISHEELRGKGWRLSSEQQQEPSSRWVENPPIFFLPPWLKNPPLPETSPQFLRPSEDTDGGVFEASELGAFGTQRGILIHRLLETLASIPQESRSAIGLKYLKKEGIPKNIATEVIESVNKVFKAYPDLFSLRSQGEVPIMGKVGDFLISGQIDRLVMAEDHILCVDFKTHTLVPEKLSKIPQTYIRQMALYQAALSQIYPDVPILCGILWTHLPRMDLLPDSLLKKLTPSIDETAPYLYTEGLSSLN